MWDKRPTDCSPSTNWSEAAFARYMTIDLRFSFSLNNHVNLLIPHLIRKLDSSFRLSVSSLSSLADVVCGINDK